MNDEQLSLLRQELIGAARRRQTVTYGEVALRLGLDIGLSFHRAKLIKALHRVCGGENEVGRPLLGAVVVSKSNRIPGKGFFSFSRDLGLYADSDDNGDVARRYHGKELERVYAAWAAPR